MITIPIHNYPVEVGLNEISNMLKDFVQKVERVEHESEETRSINTQYYERIKELEGILNGKITGTETESGSESGSGSEAGDE
jgi:hypothetical protein